MAEKEFITLLAVGDVLVNRKEPDTLLAYVAPLIRSSDIAFCQLETNYSERGTPLPQARVPLRAHPTNAPAIQRAGFRIVSFASNHHLDWGADALLDTIDVMRQTGVSIIGVGRNIEEARKPKIIECKGTRIAFLAYSSILPIGYWADTNKPGCAPLRAYTFYEQIEHDQPATPARIHSFAHEGDKVAMVKDIALAKTQADLVMVSMHFGIHFKEAEIAEYQREYAYTALDSGADAILGHHAHILKPIEVYKGKPIFYSLCNFAFDLPLPETVFNSPRWQELMAINPSWTIDLRYRAYPFPADSRMSMIAKILISEKRIKKVSFLPVLINEDSQPRVLIRQEKEFGDVLKYMEKITKNQKIDTQYVVEGDEIAVRA